LSTDAANWPSALGLVALAASFALAVLPACNECDSSLDPVKCSDLCTQDPPHADCAQCRGDTFAGNCPQCQGSERDPHCPSLGDDGGESDGSAGVGDAGGMTSGTGGHGGTAGVSGGAGGMTGGLGGAGGDDDAGVLPALCDADEECGRERPVCNDEHSCAGCEDDAICETRFPTQPYCDDGTQGSEGACVECADDSDCGETATPECVLGFCKECQDHGDCTGLEHPQCTSDGVCIACTEGGDACAEHGMLAICDTRAANTTLTEGQCVQCLSHTDCENPTPQCNDAGRCVPCTDNDDACVGRDDGNGISLLKCNTHLDRTTTGQCVECIGDSLTSPSSNVCGDKSCLLDEGRCSETDVDSVAPCGACATDTECNNTDLKCVVHSLPNDSNVGSYCFYDKATQNNACSSGLKPYTTEKPGPSVDGYVATYCVPSTSCEAYRDALISKTCTQDQDCGLGTPSTDGVNCTGATPHCTYTCNLDNQCPGSGQTDCSGTPEVAGYCQQ
jgi:hypothetical protein